MIFKESYCKLGEGVLTKEVIDEKGDKQTVVIERTLLSNDAYAISSLLDELKNKLEELRINTL